MKATITALLLYAATIGSAHSLTAQAAPRVSTPLAPTELAALEAVRKAVWVNWFSGDTAALRRVLTPELVAMSPDSPHWQSLSQTIKSSAEFKAGGSQLISVNFDSTATHHFGEVVVMFSHYAVVTQNGQQRSTQKGRATEVFVRNGNRWVHTSWQLDVIPPR